MTSSARRCLSQRRSSRAALLFLASGLLARAARVALLLAAFALGAGSSAAAEAVDVSLGQPGFIGSESCAACHLEQTALWADSHHARSQASIDSLRAGDASLSGVDVNFHGQRTRFERQAGGWVARVTEANRTVSQPLRYRFGFDPLQQFVVEAADGRLQVLNVAWDARPDSEGGQRWFHLQASAAPAPGGFAHWDSPQMNWNRNCASCHTTGFRRGYQSQANSYDTTYAEGLVGCEACHGPGEQHAESARAGNALIAMPVAWPNAVRWARAEGSRVAAPLQPPHQTAVEQCSRCHSLRAELSDHVPGQPFLSGYAPSPMTPEIFHADGQVHGESFVWAAFAQSRMFAAGVDCTDCHEPHSGKLLAQGDALCGQCHAPAAYATVKHHGHAISAPACVDCHMREVTVMSIDGRRDHSFRVPRPDLASVGGPSSCSDCHSDSEQAHAKAIASWRGGSGSVRRSAQDVVAQALSAYWRESPGAGAALQQLVQSSSADPVARFTAAYALGIQSQHTVRLSRGELLTALLSAVERAEAPGAHNEDRSAGQVSLAAHRLSSRDPAGAEQALERALAIDPNDTRALLMLAELIESTLGSAAAIERLTAAAAAHPDLDQGAIAYATGLSRVRDGATGRALSDLDRAAELSPSVPVYALASALARLDPGASAAEVDQAGRILRIARSRHPDHGELLRAEIDVLIRLGQPTEARQRIARYAQLGGDVRWIRAMRARLQAGGEADEK